MKVYEKIALRAIEIEKIDSEHLDKAVSASLFGALMEYLDEEKARTDVIAEQLVDLTDRIEEVADDVEELSDEDLEQSEKELNLALAVTDALNIALKYGQIDGAHHKLWVIDQMVRALTGHNYDAWVKLHCAGSDGPNTHGWDVGIAP